MWYFIIYSLCIQWVEVRDIYNNFFFNLEEVIHDYPLFFHFIVKRLKLLSDEEMQDFFRNRQSKFECQTCQEQMYLFEEFKSSTLLRYKCGHTECMECMLEKLETNKKISCRECKNSLYKKSKLLVQIGKNLPFLIQKMYNEENSFFFSSWKISS